MAMDYSLAVAPLDARLIAALAQLGEAVFGAPKADLHWRLEHMPSASVACASEAGRLVGFKAGYAMGRGRYYSWLGGVHPDFRRRGIAAELMRQQHAWLRERGFETVETAANRDNLAMIRANLDHGFTVCGLRHKADRVQVLFSKDLL